MVPQRYKFFWGANYSNGVLDPKMGYGWQPCFSVPNLKLKQLPTLLLCLHQGRKYGGGVNPPAFENFVFFAQKNEKNCAFESILVTNPYERTCYAPVLPDLEILAVDAPPCLRD